MKKMHKVMIAFSIIFWLLVAMGCILTGLSLGKVPIGFYGLRTYYFSSSVDQTYYTNGLYHKQIAYNFVLYPRTKQYILDQQVIVTNQDLQKITVTYTLQYRINPTGIYNMYNKLGTNYEPQLISIMNNIISNIFTTLTQSQSRVSVQNTIIQQYNTNGKARVNTFFANAIIVQGIWVNYLQFSISESYYDSAYVYTASSSASYEAAAYNLTITNLQLNAMQSAIATTKDGFTKTMQLQAQMQYDSLISTPLSLYQEKLANISSNYTLSRILNYYPHASFNFA